MKKIKLFVSDIDGTLTDSTCHYSEKGEISKIFSHRDGRGFHLLHHETGVKTMWVTSEKGGINLARATKLKGLGTLDFYADNSWNMGKVEKIKQVCNELKIGLDEVAFIGDDTNDLEALEAVGFMACPNDAHYEILDIPGIFVMENLGGRGAVREFIDHLMGSDLCILK